MIFIYFFMNDFLFILEAIMGFLIPNLFLISSILVALLLMLPRLLSLNLSVAVVALSA